MSSIVVADFEPCGQGLVEPLQGEHLAGTHLGFELCLCGLEEAFDESAGRRITDGAVKHTDV